jgi:hypothetical protein
MAAWPHGDAVRLWLTASYELFSWQLLFAISRLPLPRHWNP